MKRSINVVHSLHCWLGLTESWNYDQVTLLPEAISSHVICKGTANLDQFPISNLYSYEKVPGWRSFWDRALRKAGMRAHLGYFEGVCKRVGAEIIHSHFGNIGWEDRTLAKKLRMRHVTTFYGRDNNGLPVSEPVWRKRYLELFDSVDRVLCEGPHMARSITALGCPSEKVKVHHLGVRVHEIAFRPRQWMAGTPLRVLIAASFREKKGICDALDALGILGPEIPVELTVIGDAASGEPSSLAEKARIIDALERNGLRAKARMLGYRRYDELMQEAYDHHIFLSPSVTACDGDTEGGAPVTILHMAASGMPVVSTRHCDIPNVLPPGTRLAAEHDVEGLVCEMRRLAENAGNWEPELAESRTYIERNFDAKIQAGRLAETYLELVPNGIWENAAISAK